MVTINLGPNLITSLFNEMFKEVIIIKEYIILNYIMEQSKAGNEIKNSYDTRTN